MTKTVTLEDRFGVIDLIGRYGWSLDTTDRAGVIDCFEPKGTIVQGMGPDGLPHRYEGAEEIGGFLDRLWEDGQFRGRQHHVDNSVFRWLDDEVIEVRSMLMITQYHPPTQPELTFAGYYKDLCVRDGDRWLFRERLYTRWPVDDLASMHLPR
jgi:hypothetical protein